MIKAGRTPSCSAPRPGDQFTSQISPRLGLWPCTDLVSRSFGFSGLGWAAWAACCLASLFMPLYLNHAIRERCSLFLCYHNFHAGIKKEAGVIECFWERTEVVVSIVEGVGE